MQKIKYQAYWNIKVGIFFIDQFQNRLMTERHLEYEYIPRKHPYNVSHHVPVFSRFCMVNLAPTFSVPVKFSGP